MKELTKIQTELKAPKNQYNSFGKYSYRSCEDILEGLKPLLKKYDCSVVVSDELVMIGERYYIKATAKVINAKGDIIEAVGYARESENKKGMDASQITGAASSYARKYALNGLFAIDDNKDADSDTNNNQSNISNNKKQSGNKKFDFPGVKKVLDSNKELMNLVKMKKYNTRIKSVELFNKFGGDVKKITAFLRGE